MLSGDVRRPFNSSCFFQGILGQVYRKYFKSSCFERPGNVSVIVTYKDKRTIEKDGYKIDVMPITEFQILWMALQNPRDKSYNSRKGL